MTTKRILVFQHLRVEHPGIFRQFFAEDGYQCVTVELDEGESIPDLKGFDALWAMGGPMDVWEVAKYPWLIDEKAAIQEAVINLKIPYVGICLGHQLLADALGGEVRPGKQPEVGVMPVYKTDQGKQCAFLKNMPDTMNCLQWHSAEVKKAPLDMEVLVASDLCGIQSLTMANHHVFTMQYHQEIIDTTVSDWSDIPEYKKSLEEVLGVNAVETLNTAAQDHMQEFNQTARQFYENWKTVVF